MHLRRIEDGNQSRFKSTQELKRKTDKKSSLRNPFGRRKKRGEPQAEVKFGGAVEEERSSDTKNEEGAGASESIQEESSSDVPKAEQEKATSARKGREFESKKGNSTNGFKAPDRHKKSNEKKKAFDKMLMA